MYLAVAPSYVFRFLKYTYSFKGESSILIVHHSYCHINLVKKTMYQWDIVKVGIYILYLPSDIHVQKYFEELKKTFHLIPL